MWFSAVVAVVWLYSTAASGIAVNAPDPCKYYVENYGKVGVKEWQDCIQAVPFDKALSLKAVASLRILFGLQSSTIYHVKEHAQLELRKFDFNATLASIEAKVNQGEYRNNWSFDYDVVSMINQFRDGHTTYHPVCTHGYFYVHAFPIVSLVDEDTGEYGLYTVQKDWAAETWKAARLGDRLKLINDLPATQWIREYTRNSPEAFSFVDPDARWNEMMFSVPTGDSRGKFAKRQLWNGEQLYITWENGTKTEVTWILQFKEDMVRNGKFRFTDTNSLRDLCFHNQTVMDAMVLPKKTTVIEAPPDPKVQARAEALLKPPSGYPGNAIQGPDYAMGTYSLRSDPRTAVLLLGSFTEKVMKFERFSRAFQEYIAARLAAFKSSGIKRLIIDVSYNNGGQAMLPYDFLNQLFPDRRVFTSITMRYSPTTWAFMKTLDNGREREFYRDYTFKDFKDDEAWLGPFLRDGEYFTPKWKQDYEQYAQEAAGINVIHSGPEPFPVENIVVVSNGLCASACASFVEGLIEHGIRTVTYGGRPDPRTPMQPIGGTKGGKMISYKQLFESLAVALSQNRMPGVPQESWMPPALPVNLIKGSINLENKFRDGSDVPLQFLYTPSCRKMPFTRDMFVDIVGMWEMARDIMWDEDGVPTECADYGAVLKAQSGSEGPNANDFSDFSSE